MIGVPVFGRLLHLLFKNMSNLLDTLPLRQRKPLRISTDIPLFTRHSSDSSSSSSSPTNQSITSSGTTPSTGDPQCFFHVLCMHDFESSDPDHLPFHKDEVLTIIKQEHSGWWAAMRPQGDRIGWIPSSFVLSLDRSKIVEYPDETLWPYESLDDPLLSAVHDPWVPVSEDYTALSFQLVTPTDLVLYKGFFDDRVRNHNYGSFLKLSNDEQTSDMGDVFVPPTPESPPPHRTRRPHFPPNPVLSEPGALRLTRPASPPLLHAALHHHPHPCGVDDHTSLLCLATPVSSDEIAPELISGLDIEEPLVLQSVSASQDGTYSDDGIDGQSQCFRSPAGLRPARPDQGISDITLLNLTILGPDNLAEQLCVLMHTLYATIRQNECLDWMTGRRSTDVTGLRHFFDTHDHIASWVQKSILAYDDMTQQTETLDFWIRVAEKCRALRNFDLLCAIILALSGSSISSLAPAWARCKHKQTFATLRDMLDVTNKFLRLMDIMDAARGPSIPFVRKYLDHIKELHVERSNNSPHQSGYAADAGSSAALRRMRLAAVSTLLRYQSLPYDFKITKSIRRFIDGELQAVLLASDWSLVRSWDIQHSKLGEQPR